MTIQPVPYVAIFLITAAALLVLAAVGWRNRARPGALYLTLMILASVGWITAYSAQLLHSTLPAKELWAMIGHTFAPLVSTFLFLFMLEYTGNDEYVDRRTVALLGAAVGITYVFIWTNPWLGLHEAYALEQIPEERVLGVVVPGFVVLKSTILVGAWFEIAYSYLLVFVTGLLLVETITQSRYVFRRQAVALLVAVLVPPMWIFLFVFGVVDHPVTFFPLSFAVTCGLLWWAIFRVELLDLTPIARDLVIEQMRAGTVVIDAHDRIVDVNHAAADIVGVEPSDLVGRTVEDAVPNTIDFDQFTPGAEQTQEVSADTDRGTRHFLVKVTPLRNHRDEVLGYLVLIYDITSQRRRERELERQVERLEEFAHMVSHDLRNPLNTAVGYLDLASETGDQDHIQSSRAALERMDGIIEDILTLAREGEVVMDPSAVSLADVAESAWDGAVESDDVDLWIETDEAVQADEAKLLRIFENLFRNADEHASTTDPMAPRGASDDAAGVTVTVGALPGGFYVEDDGSGIPPEARDSVFEYGSRDGSDGTGIGLAIVQQLVDAHGWEIELTEGSAGGARFEVTGVLTSGAARPDTTPADE